MPTAKQLGAELATKREALQAEFARFKSDDGYDMPSDQIGEFRARNEELNELGKKWEEARDAEKAAAENEAALAEMKRATGPILGGRVRGHDGAAAGNQIITPTSLGEAFTKSIYRRDARGKFADLDDQGRPVAMKHRDIENSDYEFKATMTTAAGFGPENPRSGKVQLSAQRPIRVPDILPMIPLSTANAYVYMEETTFTNNAAEIAENPGGNFGEATLVFTERTANIRKIATFLPVTDEQLADVAGMEALVNNRLEYMLMLRLDSQLLNGDGNAPNINGFYAQVTQAQAKGADPTFDAIFKGMILVQHTGFANPTAIVLHPNDWQDLRLTKTVDGVYILGNPGDSAPERLFGLPVVATPAAVQNTGLVGDFSGHSALVYRQGVEFKVSDSHSDYFTKGLQAIRCTLRAALVVFRPTAFCEVTGI
jgi:HK97 family phage major capsid protein